MAQFGNADSGFFTNSQTTVACQFITCCTINQCGVIIPDSGCCSSVRCGASNCASGGYSATLGGLSNTSSGLYSAIVGGQLNNTCGFANSFIVGSNLCATQVCTTFVNCLSAANLTSGCSVCVSTNGVLVNAAPPTAPIIILGSGTCSTLRCNSSNLASACFSGSLSGCSNTASGIYSAILGGRSNNTCTFSDSMIVGSNLCATQACTTFTNCLSANNLTAGCFVCAGTNKVLQNASFTPIVNATGYFYNTTTLSALLNTPTAMVFNTTEVATGIVLNGGGTQMIVTVAGIYNLQFSAQIYRTAGGTTETIDIWIRVNGIDVPNSNTVTTLKDNSTFFVLSWNFFVTLTAGQYVQLMWAVTDIRIKIESQPINLTIPHPATPSIIASIFRVA